MPLAAGTRLGRYKVGDPIGAGGMGEVYKAKDTGLDRTVAIKVLPSHFPSDAERRGRFEREARAASALNHPNIVTVYDIGQDEDTRYIVMEFVEGKTLRQLVAEGLLSTKQILALATQIADGLAKAHLAGIVHRDLKPDNLMVTDDGLVKIVDFGLAKLMPLKTGGDSEIDTMTKATQQGVILGTLQYMSPEQAASRPVDYRSDQFSFGSILYEMATGKLAFKRETLPQTLAAIMEDEPEPMRRLDDEIPAELESIVERCLSKSAEERYESTRDLAEELKKVPETSLIGDRDPGRDSASVDSIAVLPFRNLSGDPGQEYLADGITEALIIDLAKVGALKVISRTSAMSYKGTSKPLPKIARELKIDAIVEGSAVRFEDRIRVTAQLILAETDRLMWAESYERDFQDLLLVQREVTRAITGEIRVVVTSEETERLATARPVNPEAHEAYLSGSFHYYKLTPQDLETALSYFELALEKDPDYALAYVGIASVWGGRQQMGFVPASEATPLQKVAVLKALELDESLAEAHSALGVLKTWGEWDWPAGERAFQRAIELNPNYAAARNYYSHFLNIVGRPDEAMVQIERALELDPLNSFFHAFNGINLNFVRRYDEAIAECRAALKLTPGLSFAQQGLSQALHLSGAYDENFAARKSYLSAIGDVAGEAALTEGYAEGGYTEAMRRLAETEAERSLRTNTGEWMLAGQFIRAGENERALEFLERGFTNRDPSLPYLLMPMFDSVRDDPRFQDLLRRMNLPL